MKVCTKCKQERDFDEFNKRSSSKDGLHSRCRACVNEYKLEHYHKNRDRELERNRLSYHKHVEKRRAYYKQYYEENKERILEVNRQYFKEYYQENKSLYTLKAYERAEYIKRATPRWASREKIIEIYRERELLSKNSGVTYHVDHIIPLRGKNVCGLHVEYNLQIIPDRENFSKNNKFQ